MASSSAHSVGVVRLVAAVALVVLAAILGIPPTEPVGAAAFSPVPSGPPEDGILIGSHDFDEDGTDDDLYAVPDGNTADPLPRVEIISGADDSQIAVITGDAVGDRFGAAVDMLWDLDEDGDIDLIIGAPGSAPLGAAAPDTGNAYIFHGPFYAPGGTVYLDTTDAHATMAQEDGNYIHFGVQVTGTNDLTLDGVHDIGVRSRAFVDTDPPIWRTYLYDGATGDLINVLPDTYENSFWSDTGGPRGGSGGVPQCGSADINIDGQVNLDDLLIVIANWGACADCESCPGNTDPEVDCVVGLSDLLAVIGQWGTACDSDGDGMPDWWEDGYGLYGIDLFTDDADMDADMDGLSNLEEYLLGINPVLTDSDGDGAPDGQEVNSGTDPNDGSDDGTPTDPDEVLYVTITIGDQGDGTCGEDSHFSELWGLRIGDALYVATPDDINNPDVSYVCPNGNPHEAERAYRGVWTSQPIPLVRNQSYDITVEHLGTDWSDGDADYDYTASVTPVASPVTGEIVCHHLSDPDGLFGQYWDPPSGINLAAGKVATIGPPRTDIQIDFDNDGDIDDDDDEGEVQIVRAGKLVALNDDDDDQNLIQDWNDAQIAVGEDDLVPVRLTVADLAPDATGTWSLTYTSERINILRSNTGNRDVIPSGVGQPLPIPEHVYVEAIAVSERKGDVFITFDTSDIVGGDPDCAEDIVRLTCIDVSFVGRDFSIQINSDGWAATGPGDDAAIEIPVDEALNVSNYVPGEGHGVNNGYGNVGTNPDLFRIQVDNAARVTNPRVTLTVFTPAGDDREDPVTKNLTNRDGHSFQGSKWEVVSDAVDDNTNRLLAMPGDTVQIHFVPRFAHPSGGTAQAQPITRSIRVGRPESENNNDPVNQRKHDVRVLTVRTHVFQELSGALSEQLSNVEDDIQVLRERMAQATIRVAWDEELVVHALPDALDDGLFVREFEADPFTSSEQAIVDINQGYVDAVLDIVYVNSIAHGSNQLAGVAFTKSSDPGGSGNAGHNFVVKSSQPSQVSAAGPYTLPHEVMHVLLDSAHRDLVPPFDPPTALFSKLLTDNWNAGERKRIGPNFQTPPFGASAGANDTNTIRDVVETLP